MSNELSINYFELAPGTPLVFYRNHLDHTWSFHFGIKVDMKSVIMYDHTLANVFLWPFRNHQLGYRPEWTQPLGFRELVKFAGYWATNDLEPLILLDKVSDSSKVYTIKDLGF